MPVLEILDLQKSFRSPDGEQIPVIHVASFKLNEKEQVAMEGSSGSGKTTFLNLIAGILQADSGQISVAGKRMTGQPEAVRDSIRAAHIGYVFQTFNLLQGYTALENVALGMMFGRGVDYDYARELLQRVGLKDRMDYLPRQLSVGQQQRVAVARALAGKPTLVLADEPTGNLDFRNAKEALDLIRGVCKESNAALLLVSHDREVLAQFEKVENLSTLNSAAAQEARR